MQDDAPLQLEKHLELRSALSTVQSSSLVSVWRNAPKSARLSVLAKFLKSRFGPGKLSSGEFIQFGFCNPGVGDDHISRFAGKRAQQAFNKIYNDKTWYALTKNKIAFEALMRGAELPSPETIAIYDRKGRGAGAPVLTSAAELEEFLLDPANHPFFCKPTTGLLSIGSFRIDRSDGENLIVNGHHEYKSSDVMDYIRGISKKGYLFQRVLEPHPEFCEIDCNVISSVRFLVLNREEGAHNHSCALKVPAPGEVADNFWRTGSVLCAVNLETGKIDRAVLKGEDGNTPLDRESSYGQLLYSFQLPEFEQAKECVLKASRFLPGVRVQSWDVALTTKGPVLLEVNFGGDLNLSQLSSDMGIMTPDFCQVLRDAGYQGKLPA